MEESDVIAAAELQPGALEKVDPQFVRDGLLRAQDRSWKVLEEVRAATREGMTEDDARRMALEVFSGHGVTKHWHRPYIRFGAGTRLTFHDPIQPDYRLRDGDPFYVDLGPVWKDAELDLEYEGDVGETFVLGANAEAQRCADSAKAIFVEAHSRWQTEKLSGEAIYRFIAARAQALGYDLAEKVDGHRTGDFPHQKYSRERLARVQHCPAPTLWVLEVQLLHPKLPIGAFYEDVLRPT